MITEVTIKNYRSIVDATVPLAPFTLLIGANGTGKSNFIRGIAHVTCDTPQWLIHYLPNNKHVNHLDVAPDFEFKIKETDSSVSIKLSDTLNSVSQKEFFDIHLLNKVGYFDIDPKMIGKSENLIPKPVVKQDGSGAVQVLDSLFTGVSDEKFYKIETLLSKYVPEVEKLRFETEKEGMRRLVVSEEKVKKIPLQELSDGTRYLLTVLTILFQESPPDVICLEEIDRGLHPRLYSQLMELFHDVVRETKVQIIATTHNPYLLDEFHEREDAVIVVEKENGESKFTQLSKRMEAFEELERMPLGEMWYLGVLGGVPDNKEVSREAV